MGWGWFGGGAGGQGDASPCPPARLWSHVRQVEDGPIHCPRPSTAFRAVPLARLLGPVTDYVQLQDLCMMHGIKKSPVRPAGSCVQGAEPVLLAGFPEAEAAVKLAACNSFLQ